MFTRDTTQKNNIPPASLTGFRVIKNYKIWFGVSGAVVMASAVLLVVWGLKPGIDFTGGSLSEIKFIETVEAGDLRQELQASGFADVLVQSISANTFLVKTVPLDEAKKTEFGKVLNERFGEFEEMRFESIGPTIGRELLRKAYLQIVLVVLGIIIYVSYAFRKISTDTKTTKISSWRLGITAIIALIHDILITMGLFAVLGRWHGVYIDTLFVTALLTILGFSVHDTIVVFDRIRENIKKYRYKSLGAIVDYSINSTLARSINTSLTLVFVLLALLLFGGETIFYFVLALLVGVGVGTYSSIFIAAPILYLWAEQK